MRETLTVLAGLLVLALLAALVAPGFVDWRVYRSEFEQRIGAALGVETRIGGSIGLRLLPSPKLALADVHFGGQDGAASSLSVEALTFELGLASLARGDFRIMRAEADGATLALVSDAAGTVKLPKRGGAGLSIKTSLDQLTLRRSAVIWREDGGEPVTVAPIAAELSAVSLAGPWRAEGEVAGASVRLSTGALEADGRLRAKGFVTGDEIQLSFDGAFLLPGDAGGLKPGLEGAFTMAPGGALALSGKVSGGGRQLDLANLVVDIAGGAARLEGEGQFAPLTGNGALALRARRIDADALAAALAERPGFARALNALSGTLDIGLDLDQLVWRGEDFTAAALRGKLNEDGLKDATASLRVAGALIGASGALDAEGARGKLNLKVEDARRLALVLARTGLDGTIADSIGDLRGFDGNAAVSWNPERLLIERLSLAATSGVRLEGGGELTPQRLNAKLILQGLDLGALPAGDSLARLAGGRDLGLDLTLNGARYRGAPPGSARLDLRREGANWRLNRLAVDGFGGVSVSGAGALLPEGGEISGRIRAPRFEALAALAGPLLPDALRQALARTPDALSGLDASYRLTRAASGETVAATDGGARAGRFTLNGRLDTAGRWSGVDLRFDIADRRQLFTALGLPTPRTGGTGRLVLAQAADQARVSLAGPGLSLQLDGQGDARRLTLQADAPGQVLPEGIARMLPDGLLDANALARFRADGVTLDELVANLGGSSARGGLDLPRDGPVSGRLALQRADLRGLFAAALGPSAPAAGGWSSVRFGSASGLGDLQLAIEAGSLQALDGVTLRDARFSIRASADGLSIADLAGDYGGGRITGQISARRDGGLAQVSGKLGLDRIDIAGLSGGALSGTVSGQVEAGGSGESPARLIAGLGGAGTLNLAGASLSRFDPNAYAHVIAGTGDDASESDNLKLEARVGEALDRASWRLGDLSLAFTLAGGLARLQPVAFNSNELKAEASGFIDLRALGADLRLTLRPLGPLPKGWPGAAPSLSVAWRGPLSDLKREADVSALSNAVAARALAREIERVEAFEADARERAQHARRLRAERETRENERRLGEFIKAEEERQRIEEARRLAEEKKAEEARMIEARRLEDARKAEEKRVEDARRAEEKRIDDARKMEEARQADQERRRVEAEERARAATEERMRAATRANALQPGPLILQGAPPAATLEGTTPPGAPPLPPPQQIETVPRPLSRTVQPN